MARKNSQTRVGLNAKIESFNTLPVKYDGTVVIEDGFPFMVNSSDVAAVPADGGDDVVFVNFVDSRRDDVTRRQGDPFDTTAPTATIGGGGLAGLQGPIDIGLPKECFVNDTLPAVGTLLQVDNTTGRWKGTAAAAGVRHYGVLYRRDAGRIWVLFNNNPISW